MSSRARKVKTFKPPEEQLGHLHREHRSRKNRNYRPDRGFVKVYHKKLEALRFEDLLNED